MIEQIQPGALVECTDYPLGVVEQVELQRQLLIVRPARADYLITIPKSLIREATPGHVALNVTLERVEELVLDAVPGDGHPHLERFEADPGPTNAEVLGEPEGEVPTYPPTG